jgi:D-sedoheptulose 7-phosphate isomerase
MKLEQTKLIYIDELLERIPELEPLRDQIVSTCEAICECHLAGGKVLICGNGGSASDSEHIAGELMKGFHLKRRVTREDEERLRASGVPGWESLASNLQRGISTITLTNNSTLNTAVSNDTDPTMIFAQQVYVYAQPGDILIGLSTSGRAKNVANALAVARAFGVKTIGMTGVGPTPMDELCDLLIQVPSKETYRVQEYHLPIYHAICSTVEVALFED